MTRYSIGPRKKKCVQGYGFLSFARKYRTELLDTGLDAVKTASGKVVHKAADRTSKCIGNEIAVAVAKLYGDKIVTDENPRNV